MSVADSTKVVQALGAAGSWEGVLRLLDARKKMGPKAVDSWLYTAAIRALADCGRAEEAEQVLVDAEWVGVEPSPQLYDPLFRAYAVTQRRDDILPLLDRMQRLGTPPDMRSHCAAASALLQVNEPVLALDAIQRAAAAGLEPSPASLALSARAFVASGQWKQGLLLLRTLHRHGHHAQATTYTGVIRGASKAHSWPVVVELLEALAGADEGTRSRAFDQAFAALAGTDRHDAAQQLLALMRSQGVPARRNHIVTAMRTCGQGGLWRRALLLMDRAIADGVPAHPDMPDAALRACARAGEVDRALVLIRELPSMGLTATQESYAHAIRACTPTADASRARELLREMMAAEAPPAAAVAAEGGETRLGGAASDVAPSPLPWEAALAVCSAARDADGALALLREMRARGTPVRTRALEEALSACARGGRPADARRLHAEFTASGGSVGSRLRARLLTLAGSEGRWRDCWALLQDSGTGAPATATPDADTGHDAAPTPPEGRHLAITAGASAHAGQWRAALGALRVAADTDAATPPPPPTGARASVGATSAVVAVGERLAAEANRQRRYPRALAVASHVQQHARGSLTPLLLKSRLIAHSALGDASGALAAAATLLASGSGLGPREKETLTGVCQRSASHDTAVAHVTQLRALGVEPPRSLLQRAVEALEMQAAGMDVNGICATARSRKARRSKSATATATATAGPAGGATAGGATAGDATAGAPGSLSAMVGAAAAAATTPSQGQEQEEEEVGDDAAFWLQEALHREAASADKRQAAEAAAKRSAAASAGHVNARANWRAVLARSLRRVLGAPAAAVAETSAQSESGTAASDTAADTDTAQAGDALSHPPLGWSPGSGADRASQEEHEEDERVAEFARAEAGSICVSLLRQWAGKEGEPPRLAHAAQTQAHRARSQVRYALYQWLESAPASPREGLQVSWEVQGNPADVAVRLALGSLFLELLPGARASLAVAHALAGDAISFEQAVRRDEGAVEALAAAREAVAVEVSAEEGRALLPAEWADAWAEHMGAEQVAAGGAQQSALLVADDADYTYVSEYTEEEEEAVEGERQWLRAT